MLLEIHILQNFAPSNLNRDDTGSPKTCEFGGSRRARISSQAIKRAIRNEFSLNNLVPEDQRAIRSKRFVEEITRRLVASGKNPDDAAAVANAAIEAIGLKTANDKNAAYTGEFGAGSSSSEVTFRKLQVLFYLSTAELKAFSEFADANWEALLAMARAENASARDKKAAREAAATALSKKVIDDFKARLNGGRAADLALFGRMLADLPDRNIDAASQVAHAISTNRVSVEFDYYTAVDDLKPGDTEGADMIGTVEFNSACYYRYANIDLTQLKRNLGGDDGLVEAAVRAFLVASRDAIPTGKQNSFAARSAPSFIMTVVRPAGAWSLANAFVRPIHPGRDTDLVSESIQALGTYWGELSRLYGSPEGFQGYIAIGQESDVPGLGAASPDFNALLSGTLAAVAGA
jgi:CRISPR system Cascade subunit CasC